HERMGTHNSLLSLGCGVYLEFIAIDPDATTLSPGTRRWFGLDDLHARLVVAERPLLIHFVVAVDDITSAKADFERKLGDLSLGNVVQGARRRTDGSMLRWEITVREDGALLEGG